MMMMSRYHDPTFDTARRTLAKLTQAIIIEWLRVGGSFPMPILKRGLRPRRWFKKPTINSLPILVIGLVLGVVADRYLWSI